MVTRWFDDPNSGLRPWGDWLVGRMFMATYLEGAQEEGRKAGRGKGSSHESHDRGPLEFILDLPWYST